MSQFHEDYLQRGQNVPFVSPIDKGEYKFEMPSKVVAEMERVAGLAGHLCIWPDCDCEIRCDHINCSPPVDQLPCDCREQCESCSIMALRREEYKPIIRIFFGTFSPENILECKGYYVDPYTPADVGWVYCSQNCKEVGPWRPAQTLERG